MEITYCSWIRVIEQAQREAPVWLEEAFARIKQKEVA